MNDATRLLISITLVPIVWVLLSIYVFRPLEKWVNKHFPPKTAEFLTKKRWGE